MSQAHIAAHEVRADIERQNPWTTYVRSVRQKTETGSLTTGPVPDPVREPGEVSAAEIEELLQRQASLTESASDCGSASSKTELGGRGQLISKSEI